MDLDLDVGVGGGIWRDSRLRRLRRAERPSQRSAGGGATGGTPVAKKMPRVGTPDRAEKSYSKSVPSGNGLRDSAEPHPNDAADWGQRSLRGPNSHLHSGIRKMRRIPMLIIVSPVQFFFGLCFLCATAFGFGVSFGIRTGATHEPENTTR
jgi:hypothetical protein